MDKIERAILAGMERACAQPMQWGRDDCALWCADILDDALGYDAAEPFRRRYRTSRGARRVTGKRGLVGALTAVARRHGWTRIDPQLARPGDIGVTIVPLVVDGKVRRRHASMICRAPGWFVGRNEYGFTALPARAIKRCWATRPRKSTRVSMPAVHARPAFVPTSAVAHEPVSTAIGLTSLLSSTGLFGAGTILGGLGVTAGAVGGAIVGTAISVGLSYASQALTQRGNQPLQQSDGINDLSIRYNTRQALPVKRIIYGSAQVGGALFFEEGKPPYLYQGILICARPITAFRRMWIGSEELKFAAFTPNTVLAPLPVDGQPDYPNRLQVSLRLGSTSQAIDPLLDADFTSLDSGFRQRGIATAVMRYHYGGTTETAATQAAYTKLWGQVQRPNPLFLVDGVAVYDPRDPTQDRADETTWKFSNTAALVQADYLRQPYGGRIPAERIDWDKVAEAATWDEGVIGCLDGTLIRRHTIDGVVALNQSPAQVLSGMLSANRGFILETAGRVWASSSKPRAASIATIHDAILSGGIQYRAAKPKRDLVNRLKVRFVAEDREYQVVDGPVLVRADLETADDELLESAVDLPFTMDHRRAQRLQKAFLDTSRLGRTVTASVDVKFLAKCADDIVGSRVTISSDLFPKTNGVYLVREWGFGESFATIDLQLEEYDPDIETAWNAASHEQAFTLADLDVS